MIPASVPEVLAAWLRPFASCFTAAAWRHVLVLVAGALRVMGLDQAPGFAVYHRVLSTGRWSSRAVAHRLLLLLVTAFVPEGPVVVGVDDTIERRWGAKISARHLPRSSPLADFRVPAVVLRSAETFARRAQPPAARRSQADLTCKLKLSPKP